MNCTLGSGSTVIDKVSLSWQLVYVHRYRGGVGSVRRILHILWRGRSGSGRIGTRKYPVEQRTRGEVLYRGKVKTVTAHALIGFGEQWLP